MSFKILSPSLLAQDDYITLNVPSGAFFKCTTSDMVAFGSAKIVRGTAIHQEKDSTPHIPLKVSMHIPLEKIKHKMVAISMMNLDLGVSPIMSSMAPMYSIIPMAARIGNRLM